MNKNIIEIKELSFAYPDGTEVLKNISLEIAKGESVAVVGANGTGKSTLLLHFNGCLFPNKGDVFIAGNLINKKTIQDIRRMVGMVFQNPDDQLFMPTVFEDVAFGVLNLGLSKSEVKKRVEEALEVVGALDLKNRSPYKLSGGEKRAVSIATILSMSPEIMVMDEPTSNLDPRSRRNFIALLNKFSHTKIIATHDLDMAFDVCKRTIILHNGQIKADGLTKDLLRDKELLLENGLELPLRFC